MHVEQATPQRRTRPPSGTVQSQRSKKVKYCIISPTVSCYISSQPQTTLGLNTSTLPLSIWSAKSHSTIMVLKVTPALRNVAQVFGKKHSESPFPLSADSTDTRWLIASFFFLSFRYAVLVADIIQPRLTLSSQQFSCLSFLSAGISLNTTTYGLFCSFKAHFQQVYFVIILGLKLQIPLDIGC